MPLFKHSEPTPAQQVPARHSATNTRTSRTGSLFGSRRRSSSISPPSSPERSSGSGLGGIFHRRTEDPSITAARQRVAAAENAEREADRALIAARNSVREAKEHVKALEREAAEEARLAKIKQHEARDISKRAKPLGRKFY